MANYLVTDSELTNIATAIRNKSGTTSTLSYPTQFNSTIEDIELGYNIGGFINVTYPEGAICTAVSEDGITLTAPDTSGSYTFKVYEPPTLNGTEWTVSCTNNGEESNIEIITMKHGDVKDITLAFLPVVGNALNTYTWDEISKVAQTGLGDSYWDIGDCKAVTLNGTVGALSLSNLTLYVFILDFNHPINKNTADNNIIWGGFKTALTGGTDVALIDSKYGTESTSGIYFTFNHVRVNTTVYNSNYGGWKGCDFRYDILGATSTAPSPYNSSSKSSSTIGYDATASTISSPVANTLMAALPSDLRAVLRLWDRYIDFKGNSSNIDANCSTATVDAISLLTEFEIFGSRTYANQYEQNHQKQMAYYANGNSKVKYRHNSTGSTAVWITSSPYCGDAQSFSANHPTSGVVTRSTKYGFGLAPAFKT